MMKARVFLILIFLLLAASCNRAYVEEKILYVAPQMAPCKPTYIPEDPSKANDNCVQISDNPNGPFQSDVIKGFNFESGYLYKLRVRSTYPDTSILISHTILELIETLEKTPVN
jgi:hypothetical protein